MEWMIKLITVLYLGFNTVRVFSYLPQILAVAKERSAATAIALPTWGFWTMANFTTGLYATFVVPDYLLAIMSYGNTLGCAVVAAIVIYKRRKYGGIIFSFLKRNIEEKAEDKKDMIV